ncbi:phosphodiesterase [Devosia submarina]|uniref:phosphodiesterase n=1 Tax=Devosia submarina TaxID=1173082 RepID=UPI001AEC8484|nr:phosphodiesterase [Devosia submarina]
MIEIISHRGYWKTAEEKNAAIAFERSFSLGYGTETDVRDSLRNGRPELVISHDVPSGGELLLSDVLGMAVANGSPTLALNIKADGLADRLKDELARFSYQNYFLFDNSVPDLIQTEKRGLRCFTRLSEFEPDASLYTAQNVVGVWIDAFQPGRWYESPMIERIIGDGKQVCLVCPDLHKRDDELEPFLEWLVTSKLVEQQGLIVCTDQPELAAARLQPAGASA